MSWSKIYSKVFWIKTMTEVTMDERELIKFKVEIIRDRDNLKLIRREGNKNLN